MPGEIIHKEKVCGRALHVEVGGPYGGSVRALRMYLAHADPNLFIHDVACMYPVPGVEEGCPGAQCVMTVYEKNTKPPQNATGFKARLRNEFKERAITSLALEVQEWIALGKGSRAIYKLNRLMRQKRYSVVHVNNTFPYQAATIMAAHMSNVPIIAHVRNPVDALAFNRMLMRRINTIVTVAACYEKDLSRWGTGTRILTCHDSVQVPTPDVAKSDAIRSALLGPGKALLVGSIGRLSRQKGYDTFIQAARIIANYRHDVCFAVCGNGPERDYLQRIIHELALQDRFRLYGFLSPSDAISFLAALDVFVSSSNWEGLPTAIVEALVIGKPVIATDVGGTSEVIVAERTGHLVPAGDPDLLGRAILSLLDGGGIPGHARAGRDLALSLTNPAANARRFDRLLEEVASQSLV